MPLSIDDFKKLRNIEFQTPLTCENYNSLIAKGFVSQDLKLTDKGRKALKYPQKPNTPPYHF